MGVYTRHNDSVSWREQYIFGSSRLGLYRADTLVNKGLTVISKLYEGKRNYELTNHLGNVMAVINDRKTDSLNGTTKVGFNAVVISATDYYPFGMAIDSRSYTSSLYRYGFNGKENDKEVGEIDFGDRLYDPRIGGRFLSIDFSTKKYPSNTPYSSFNNNPLVFVDPDGNDNIVYILTLQNVPKLIIDRAIEKANAYLRIMGLKTTVVRAEANFDISKLDATDGMVIIGNNKNQVANYVHKTKNFEGIVDTRLLSNNKDDERSVENWHQYKSPDSKGDPNGDTPEISSKNLGLITLNGLEGFKKNLENDLVPGNRSAIKNYEELLGLIIVHSMGHQADVNHNDNAFMRGKDDQYERGFMATGNGLAMHIRGSYGTFKALPIKTVDQLFSNDTTGNNGKPRTESKVVDKMKLRFQPNNEEPKARANEKN